MFGLGPTELLLILAIIMIIFGAGKLPQVFGALGKGVKEFRDASDTSATANGNTTVVRSEAAPAGAARIEAQNGHVATTTTSTTPTV